MEAWVLNEVNYGNVCTNIPEVRTYLCNTENKAYEIMDKRMDRLTKGAVENKDFKYTWKSKQRQQVRDMGGEIIIEWQVKKININKFNEGATND